MFINYYLICLVYCFFMQIRSYRLRGSEEYLGMTPGFDAIAIVIMCWAMAPVDLFLTWKRLYMESKKKA